jgi:CBS domain-containing protein
MKEYLDFLGSQAPYDALTSADLERLASSLEVEYFRAGTVIVADGAEPLDHMYVVRAGSVEVLDRGRVVDLLGPGDTFGHVSVLSGMSPALSVRAAEDTLCFRFPDPRTILAEPGRLRFAHYGMLIHRPRLTDQSALVTHAMQPIARFIRPIVWCDPSEPVEVVAERVTAARQSAAVVRLRDGLGIVTDNDFRRCVGSGRVPPSAPVADIATVPALTIDDVATVAQASLLMVHSDVHHLVVVDRSGRPSGLVRVVDLASVELRDPLLIRSAVARATDVDELSSVSRLLPASVTEMVDAGVPSLHVAALLATVREAVLLRLVDLVVPDDEMGTTCSWMVLGSTARAEPLPGSDLDTAVAWDGEDEDPLADDVRAAAGRLLDAVERCGMRRCPDGANATNPLFGRSVRRWERSAALWATESATSGTALLASMLADSRALTGLAVGRSLIEAMTGPARNHTFQSELLRLTVADRPPTGFVRDFVVDHSGEHRGQLDLKRGGLRPVVAIGRWAAIVTGDTRGPTVDRLRRAQAHGLLSADEADTLVGAYQGIFSLVMARETDAIRNGQSPSSYVDPREIDSLTRRQLRETFRAVADLQRRLSSDWASRTS